MSCKCWQCCLQRDTVLSFQLVQLCARNSAFLVHKFGVHAVACHANLLHQQQWHACPCRVRALGDTVEAILSEAKHPKLLKQLLDNIDNLQKARSDRTLYSTDMQRHLASPLCPCIAYRAVMQSWELLCRFKDLLPFHDTGFVRSPAPACCACMCRHMFLQPDQGALRLPLVFLALTPKFITCLALQSGFAQGIHRAAL